MTLKEQILKRVSEFPGSTDTELELFFKKSHQQINQTCRHLERQGFLLRRKNPFKGNVIGNFPTGIPFMETHQNPDPIPQEGQDLQEEDIKRILTDKLCSDGWSVKTAWGHSPGADIDATKNGHRWLIEVKGPGSRSPMRVNYFLSILGEILQRMEDPKAKYSIALPDMEQYRRLWNKLPKLAKERTTIDLILVDQSGKLTVLN